MTVAIVASLVGLGCLLLGYWIGYQVGRQLEWQQEWARVTHPAWPAAGEEP